MNFEFDQNQTSSLKFDESEAEGTILQRFDFVASRLPGWLAVHTDNYQWTYSELDSRANAVAQVILKNRGMELEPVALLLEHDAPIIASILGVIKAGKFYTALNNRYPHAYLEDLLERHKPAILITDSCNQDLAHQLLKPGCELVNYDDLDIASSPVGKVPHQKSDSPFAVFYTSGTTGKPKGVIRNHRLVVHRSFLIRQFLPILPSDRLSLMTTSSFAVAASDIFSSLLNGCTLCLFPTTERSSHELAGWLHDESISLFHPPISLFRNFVGQLTEKEFFPKMRLIMLGGDVLFRRDIEFARDHFPSSCLFEHQYASSEAGLIARNVFPTQTAPQDPIIPVGFPVPGRDIRIMDEAGNDVGVGHVGEITVRSRFLSSGYWNRPEETNRRFISISNASKEKYFLTGDIGRIRPDGMLEFLGRSDSMVKVRGYRIELAKVESVLLETGVQDAVVVPQNDLAGEKHLVAYLVPGVGYTKNPKALHLEISQKLPEYMLPSYYIYQTELPRLANGKVNLRSLPNPLLQDGRELNRHEAPQFFSSPIEQGLYDIVSLVLRNRFICADENLFTCGCNSVLVAQITSRIADVFKVYLSPRVIYDHPTIAGIAKILQTKQDEIDYSLEGNKLDKDVLDYLSQFG